jgi:hypothetical protein
MKTIVVILAILTVSSSENVWKLREFIESGRLPASDCLDQLKLFNEVAIGGQSSWSADSEFESRPDLSLHLLNFQCSPLGRNSPTKASSETRLISETSIDAL